MNNSDNHHGCLVSPYEAGESKKKSSSCSDPMTSPHSHSGEDSYGDGYDSDHSVATTGGKVSDKESRKNAEKQRRTVLNGLISQISSLLPVVATSNKKVDKTSIMRLAANFLRIDHIFGNTINECQQDIRPSAADSLLGLLGGFLLTTTVKGVIVVVSPNVVNYLGYSQIDLFGHNILNITHPEDVETVRENLDFPNYSSDTKMGSPEHGRYYLGYHSNTTDECPNERRDFLVRFAKAGSRSEPLQYVLCRVDGSFRKADRAGLYEGRTIKRQRVRKDRVFHSSGNDFIFVGVVRILGKPFISDRLLEASKQEYWTRHLVDGHIVHCDQRISLVAGYMSEEVIGVSAFTFMHKEDVRWVVIALRQMYDGSKLCGESCYRLVSRTGKFIYLRTKGFLEIDRSTKAAQSFVCINSLVSDEDGIKLIADMRRKYSATVNLEGINLEEPGEDSTEDPMQLEQVIMHLITNLPSPNNPGPQYRYYTQPPVITPEERTDHTVDSLRIIPPDTTAVKSSFVKSLNVMAHSGLLKKRPRAQYESNSDGCKRVCYDSTQSSSDSDKDYG